MGCRQRWCRAQGCSGGGGEEGKGDSGLKTGTCTAQQQLCHRRLGYIQESREAHWRLDYPRPDVERWLKNIISRERDGSPVIRVKPVAMTRIHSPGPCKIGTRWTWGYVRSES
ncbi:MAG TPA: hypothetical protein EYP53_02870 [Candidatus Latescibacteria bacterium]|nr:hypothetical protein [Candidatus Latescibacterota bacterium]